MARIGDTLRPELGKTDARAIAQGGAAMGRGLAGLGAGIGDYLKQQKEDKKGVVGEIKMGRMMEEMYGGESKVGRAFGQLADSLDDETMPWKNKVALAGMGSKIRSMIMHKSEVDTLNALNERKMSVSEGGLAVQRGGLAVRQGEAQQKANAADRVATAGQMIHFWQSNKGEPSPLPVTPAQGQQPLPTGSLGPPHSPGVAADGSPGVLPLKPGSSTQAAPVVPVGTPLPGSIDSTQVAPGTPEGTPRTIPTDFQDFVNRVVPQEYRAAVWDQAKVTYKPVSYTRKNPETGRMEEVTTNLQHIRGIPQYEAGMIPTVAKGRMFEAASSKRTQADLAAWDKLDREALEETRTLARDAAGQLPMLAMGINLLASGDVKTGFLEPTKNKLKEVFGIDVEGLTKFQVLRDILGSEQMAQIGKTKGSISNTEMAFFATISANPGKTVEANLIVLRAKAKVLQRLVNESKMISEWRREGRSSSEMRSMLEKTRADNPVITETDMRAIYGDSYGKKTHPGLGGGDNIVPLDATEEQLNAELEKLREGQ